MVHGADSCTLLLFEGGDSTALVFALNARFGLGGMPFHLTLPGSRSVVPLTAALPGGLTLLLHAGATPGAVVLAAAAPVAAVTAAPVGAAQAAASVPSFASSCPAGGREPVATDWSRSVSGGHPAVASQLGAGGFAPETMELGQRGVSAASIVGEHAAAFSMARVQDAADSLDRFSRLSTDLANERTLLAWLRTAMACIRTALAFIGISAEGPWWMSTVHITRIAMVTAVLVATLSGVKRYSTIKEATYQPVPPQHFGRVSIHYFNFTLAASVVALAIGMYPAVWTK